MQGYNSKGEYSEFMDKYIEDNTNIKVINKELIYNERIKNIFIDMNRIEKNLYINDYVGALSHLRRANEILVSEVLNQSEILPYEYIDLTTYNKLKLIDKMNLLENKEIDFLHEIRQTGNEAVHGGIVNPESTKMLIISFKEYLHKWIDK